MILWCWGRRYEVFLFRLGLLIGLVSAVVTIIYLTPVPELSFASCDRPCHELDWPMICRFKLVLEQHQSMGGWCGDCPKNISHCFRPGCVIAEGKSRRILAANRQLPGPSIQVCENDILVIDVVNRMPGQGVALHWRGQKQVESPYMDGVPMITQCPISSYTAFQYKFRAAQAGTHMWHSHTGNELLDGLFGPLIVRKADRTEEHRHLYDVDDPNHILVFNEWGNSEQEIPEGNRILVNGISNSDLTHKLTMTRGLRHRIRVIHAGGGTGCPLSFRVEDHHMTAISIDGKQIYPVKTSTIQIAQGERLDFVLHASLKKSQYKIEVTSSCVRSPGLALLVYNNTMESHHDESSESFPVSNIMSTVYTPDCLQDPDIVCLPEIKSLRKNSELLSKKRLDVTLFLPFDYVDFPTSGEGSLVPRMNNLTFSFPPSPILSQFDDIDHADICNSDHVPARCKVNQVCECVHIVDIPLLSTVELILVNKDKFSSSDHVFHFHGHNFRVVGFATDLKDKSLDDLKELDRQGSLFKRNLVDPVEKDTVTVPKNGAVAVRFKANHAGYWLLHDQLASKWARGMDVIFKVGTNQDLPPIPDQFPQCGSWIGPQFFLI